MKYCSKCNIHFNTTGDFCARCGSPLTEVTPSFCPQCGAKLQDGDMFCSECGMHISGVASGGVGLQTVDQGLATLKQEVPKAYEKLKNSIPERINIPKDINMPKSINMPKNINIPKEAIIGGAVALLILLGGGYYFLTHNDKTVLKVPKIPAITGQLKNNVNNLKNSGNDTTKDTSKGTAGTTVKNDNIQQAQPIRPGVVTNAYHSSADREGSYVHSAALAVDGNAATCWSEGVSGLGIGENIVFHFNGIYKVSGLNIWVGHQKSQSLFYQNARPTSIRVEGSDGSSEVYSLRDTFGAQRIDFKKPINTSLIKIIVNQVVPGNKYEDTCIAEVSFF